MKSIILVSVFFIIGNSSFAKGNNKEQAKNHQLDYDECIERYGIDDTSIAIINVYFDKRYNAGVGQMSILPITLVTTLIIPPIGVVLTLASSPVFINGVITHHRYNYKNMIKSLQIYQNEGILSDRMRSKVVNYTIDEKDNSEIEQVEDYLTYSKNAD